MKSKQINLVFLICFFVLHVNAQTLTMECGAQKQTLTELNQTRLEFFESDTLRFLFNDNNAIRAGLASREILIIPKVGNSYYEKNIDSNTFVVTGMLQMHKKKILAEGTKIIITIKRKNYPDKCFITMII